MANSSNDAWYVRLPDSNVVRANSTRSVRHHIETGTIPPASHARRSHRENWVPIFQLEPFADLLGDYARNLRERREKIADINDRAAGSESLLQLHAAGVRGLVNELINALDSTLTRRKLIIAGVACLIFGLLLLAYEVALNLLVHPWALVGALGEGFIALLTAAVCTIFLTQLTFIELSQLRPARLGEAAHNLSGLVLRLLICFLVVFGSIGAVLYVVNWLPEWLLLSSENGDMPGGDTIAAVAVVVQILLEVALLPLLGFALLLGPLVVIEEVSVFRALAQWTVMIRYHLRRLFLYESLAAAVALVASLPFLVPVSFAALNVPGHGTPGLVAEATLDLLKGLACTPAFAYLTVANVFIYLNLRYELPPAR